ncbi:MAG: alpha/beta hydrolase family protein [Candidatus Sigynarchaeota archaeon]
MRRFALKYLILRTLSTVAGVVIIIVNLTRRIDYDRSFFFGIQTFLLVYVSFFIADSVSRFWWNRWRPVDANVVNSKTMTITVSGGRSISGIMHEPAFSKHLGKGRGIILVSYGFNDNQFRATHIAQALAAAGFSVFSWDYRGRGKNRGRITDLKGHVADLMALIDHFSNHPFVTARPVFLLGWSMGGMVSIQAGLHNERVSKIFVWSTWSDLRKRVLWRLYLNPFATFRYLFKGELLYVSRESNKLVSPVHYFESLARDLGGKDKVVALARDKLFLCHARNDTMIGFDNFVENVRWLQLPKTNQISFKKGSHFMLRKEPILIGLACHHFSGGDTK